MIMARERVLEKKIVTLEQRLMLVERFVEMRFCETFRDFSVRNLPVSDGRAQVTSIQAPSKVRVDKRSEKDIGKREYSSRATVIENEATFDDSDSFSPTAPDDFEEEDEPEVTSYRTRSGRKSTRLTAKGMGRTSSKRPNEKPISGKVLRVTVSRLEEQKKNNAPVEPTETIIKMDAASDDYADNQNDLEGEDEYFTFPSGHEENMAFEENDVEYSPDADDDYPAESDMDMDDNDDDDADLSVSGEPGPDNSKRKKQPKPHKPKIYIKKIRGKNVVDEETRNKRRKYYKRGSIKQLPEGVRLEKIKQDGSKECPFCHAHYKVEHFDQHLMTQHMKERHLKCPQCDKRFFLLKTLQQHQRLHRENRHGNKNGDKCRICKKLIHRRRILGHERTCVKQFLENGRRVDPDVMDDLRKRSFKVDLNWPDPNEKIPEGKKKCVHCKKLIEDELMTAHLKANHANWKCTFCDKTYVLKHGLVRHLCNAHGDNKKNCEFCEQDFETSADFRAHFAQCQKEYQQRSKETTEDLVERIRQKMEHENDNETSEAIDDDDGNDGTVETSVVDEQEETRLPRLECVDHSPVVIQEDIEIETSN